MAHPHYTAAQIDEIYTTHENGTLSGSFTDYMGRHVDQATHEIVEHK
jgi:hypothetical protein